MNKTPSCVRSLADLRAALDVVRAQRRSIGFVPTMGALHDGHLSLVREAQARTDVSVVSIFVNPTQFAPGEDLDSYPRTEEADLEKLAGLGCDIIYMPGLQDMYPDGTVTNVRVEGLSDLLDGIYRPHFFYGVSTVVARLFIHVAPDVAVFGEKDYQQLQIIRRMVRDLAFPIEIVGAPTVRDHDGLAQSSRNAYLAPDERARANIISETIFRACARLSAGADTDEVVAEAAQTILNAGFESLDYVRAVDPETLADLPSGPVAPGFEGRVLAAAWMGKTRLIDNAGFVRADAVTRN